MEASGQLYDPDTLTPGEEPVIPTGYESGLAPEGVWTLWDRENF
jgi:hypothetical protein